MEWATTERGKKLWENNWPFIACAFESIKKENYGQMPMSQCVRADDFGISILSEMEWAPSQKWDQIRATMANGALIASHQLHWALQSFEIHSQKRRQCGRGRILCSIFTSILRISYGESPSLDRCTHRRRAKINKNARYAKRTKGRARLAVMRQKWNTIWIRWHVCVCVGGRQ